MLTTFDYLLVTLFLALTSGHMVVRVMALLKAPSPKRYTYLRSQIGRESWVVTKRAYDNENLGAEDLFTRGHLVAVDNDGLALNHPQDHGETYIRFDDIYAMGFPPNNPEEGGSH